MKKNSAILILFFVFISLSAIDINLDISAYSNATGGINLITASPSSAFYNPSFAQKGIELSYTNLFSMKDLSYNNLYYSSKLKYFGFATGTSFLNNPIYKEGSWLISFSKSFYGVNFGVSSRVVLNKIGEEKAGTSVAFDIGFYKRFKKFSTAFSWKNITNSKIDGENLPVFYLWEFSYKLSRKSDLAVGLEKQTEYDFIYKFATVYKFNKYFHIFTGYRFNPQRLGFGFTVLLKKTSIAYSVLTHPDLPLTHYISICYAL